MNPRTSAHAIVLACTALMGACALASLLLAMLPDAALAHVPGREPAGARNSIRIDGPDVSRAYYGYLAPEESADEYTTEVQTAVTSRIGIIVPAWASEAEFRPTLVVQAEGAEPIRIQDPGTSPRVAEFEPFSLTSFAKGGEADVTFEPGKRYTLRVEPGENAAGNARAGRYVIVFGGPEEFGADDIKETFASLPSIWFGTYGGAPFHLNWLAVLLCAVVACIFVLVAAVVIKGVRRRLE